MLNLHTLADHVAGRDPAGLLYGALIAAAVLATASSETDDAGSVALSTLAVLLIYFLAHVYIGAQQLQFAGDRRQTFLRLQSTARHELSVIYGGLPAIVLYVVVHLAGATSDAAASVAVYFSIAVLVAVGYLAAHRAGRSGRAAALDAVIAGLLGVVVILAKASLH